MTKLTTLISGSGKHNAKIQPIIQKGHFITPFKNTEPFYAVLSHPVTRFIFNRIG